MPEAQRPTFYSALSHAPVRAAGNSVDLSIYRQVGETRYGKFAYKARVEGLVQVGGPQSTETVWTDAFEIAYTKVGDKGPLVLFLHGVPCNRAQWEDIQRYLSRFCETIAIDMLGMGQSSQPRQYGRKNEGIWKGDERLAIDELRQLHGIPVG